MAWCFEVLRLTAVLIILVSQDKPKGCLDLKIKFIAPAIKIHVGCFGGINKDDCKSGTYGVNKGSTYAVTYRNKTVCYIIHQLLF